MTTNQTPNQTPDQMPNQMMGQTPVMTFNEYLNNGWSRHGDNPEAAVANLDQGIELCRTPSDVSALVQLATHLYTDHVPKFVEGERRLREIAQMDLVKNSPAEFAIQRAIMTLRLCSETSESGLSAMGENPMGLTPADLSRSYAQAASALAKQDSVRSELFLSKALTLAESVDAGPEVSVDLARALAIAGNNSAARLEEQPTLNEQQVRLMIRMAETARKYWEIATKESQGGWLNIERAEYRLAKCYQKAGQIEKAERHAELCLEICLANRAPALETFFAYEVLAFVSKTATTSDKYTAYVNRARETFEKIEPDDRSWAESSLASL